MPRLSWIFALVLPTFFLLNCGFHLKQAQEFSPALKNLQLQHKSIDSGFINTLENQLLQHNVKLSDSASAKLNILSYTTQKKAAAVNTANARQTETRITHTLSYALQYDNKLVIAPQTIVRSKEYINNNNNLSGKIEEERLLKKTLDKELAYLLLRRLENIDSSMLQLNKAQP